MPTKPLQYGFIGTLRPVRAGTWHFYLICFLKTERLSIHGVMPTSIQPDRNVFFAGLAIRVNHPDRLIVRQLQTSVQSLSLADWTEDFNSHGDTSLSFHPALAIFIHGTIFERAASKFCSGNDRLPSLLRYSKSVFCLLYNLRLKGTFFHSIHLALL